MVVLQALKPEDLEELDSFGVPKALMAVCQRHTGISAFSFEDHKVRPGTCCPCAAGCACRSVAERADAGPSCWPGPGASSAGLRLQNAHELAACRFAQR